MSKHLKDIWSKGRTIAGKDPEVFRFDDYGNLIKFEEYDTENEMAWEYERRFLRGLNACELVPVAKHRLKRIFKNRIAYTA